MIDYKISLFLCGHRISNKIVSLDPDTVPGIRGETPTTIGDFKVTWSILDTTRNEIALEKWKKE